MEKGFYCINKPKGLTSFDIIAKIRKMSGVKKVGHAGTLDPLASGVLVVAVGKENTRKINKIMSEEKEYIAHIKLGEFSETDDQEGKKTEVIVEKEPDLLDIKKILSEFTGKISQVPPKYSAIKINGKRAYKMARENKNFNLKQGMFL